ncbi:DUF397 domain-containing protein [Kitasatospora sp. NPDC003701]
MFHLSWQKSSFSGAEGADNCLELAAGVDGRRHLRESSDPEVVVTMDAAKLRAFILGVKAGEFDHLI